jgi:serralysin
MVGDSDGDDTMQGGVGDDSYILRAPGDTITEQAGQGLDDIRVDDFSYDLSVSATQVEILAITGINGLTAKGNALNNVIESDSGGHVLDGADGNDTLIGAAGNDTLTGGLGNDNLDGGTGDDSLSGGDGDDLLNGGANTNKLAGGKGNDIYVSDTIFGHLGNDTLIGGAGNDTLFDGSGSDLIDAGQGQDTIIVGGGEDAADIIRYAINTASELANLGGDVISGFEHGSDKIDLSDLFDQFNIDSKDPIGDGFLKIEVVGLNTNILFDRNGGGDGFITLATLNNVTNVTTDDLITAQP